MIDPFHLEAYNRKAVNYNRDVEVFPVLKRILEKITEGESFYKSPTDMGVNRVGFAIVDEKATAEAAIQEIIRRYFRYRCEYAMGFVDRETVQRVDLFIKDFQLKPEHRSVVEPARQAATEAQEQGKGKRRHLLWSGHFPQGRHACDRQQFPPHARCIQRGHSCH